MTDLPVVERFRAPLLAATPRRRPLRPAAAAAAAAVLAAVLVAGLVRTDGPVLAVTTTGGLLELRIEDAGAGADELTRDLRAAGVDATVRTIAVAPDRAGTWIIAAEFAGLPCSPTDASGRGREEVTRLGDVELGEATIRVAVERVRESTGRFVFYAGRSPHAGERVVDPRVALRSGRAGTARLPAATARTMTPAADRLGTTHPCTITAISTGTAAPTCATSAGCPLLAGAGRGAGRSSVPMPWTA